MTRKDYNTIAASLRNIADAIAATGTREAWHAYVDTVEVFAHGMYVENRRFDRERFLAACGIAINDREELVPIG